MVVRAPSESNGKLAEPAMRPIRRVAGWAIVAREN
jgi:hypothetical protein